MELQARTASRDE